MKRRQFLTQAGGITAGVIGAQWLGREVRGATPVPVVSTRDHFDDSGSLTGGHTATGYDTDGTVPGVDTGVADDLFVFAHGWTKDATDGEAEDAAESKFEHADSSLDGEGYGGTVIGYSWDNNKGGGFDFGWGEAKQIAQQNGAKLAQFCVDYKNAGGGTLRIGSHSLGAQVAFSALRSLNTRSSWNDRIETTHFLGAATDNETPTQEDMASYTAVTEETNATFNYHSNDDNVLSWVYNVYEFDQALGETGAESGNTPAPNYTDFDATSQVGTNHSGYLNNVSDEMVTDMSGG